MSALLLLACVPIGAEELVFPQGRFLSLSDAEKRSYARLDFPASLPLWPARIVAAGAPAWEVPNAPAKLRWNSLFPSILVPPGDYNLVFAGKQPWTSGCVNETIRAGGNMACTANCSSTAILEPAEVALPWKVLAGERYEIKAQQVMAAPAPIVVWAGSGCLYSIARPSGYGVVDICLTNTAARHGSAAVPLCRSIRFSRTAGGQVEQLAVVPAPSASALPPSAVEEPAWLTVTSTPPGASVKLNDNFFGKTPTKLKLVGGDYSIAIELAGFTVWKRSLKLVSGSAISVDAQLAPASPTPPPAQPPQARAVPRPAKSPDPTPAHAERHLSTRGAHAFS